VILLLTNIVIEDQPIISKNPKKPYFSRGSLKIKCQSPEHYKIVCEKLRYFYIDKFECRALPVREELKTKMIE